MAVEKKTSNVRFDADVYDAMVRVIADNKISGKGPGDMATFVSLACRIYLATDQAIKGAGLEVDSAEILSATAIRRYIEDLQFRK